MSVIFRDRRDAGRHLASELQAYANKPNVLVLALPRGGVPVGFEVATALRAQLDIFLVSRLNAPGHQDLSLGAIASGGARVLNLSVIRQLSLGAAAVERAATARQRELDRREQAYRHGKPAVQIARRTVILVDDGSASGATRRAAAEALAQRGALHIIMAIPVGPAETWDPIHDVVDEVVCAVTPADFQSAGQCYENFEPTTDEEVRDLLAQAGRRPFLVPTVQTEWRQWV